MGCTDCLDDLLHCHATSLEHADGSTECTADTPCDLPHHLHEWQEPCSILEPPCPCAAHERPEPAFELAA
jgi:hypothetical protein